MKFDILARLNALTLRERIVLGIGGIAVIGAAIEFGVLAPQRADIKRLRDDIASSQAETTNLAKALGASAGGASPARDAQERAERDQLLAMMERAHAVLVGGSGAKSLESMRALAAAQPGVKLVSLKTLATEPVPLTPPPPTPGVVPAPSRNAPAASAPVPAAPTEPALQVYRSGVEITVQGPYPALAQYAANVQRALPQALWGDFALEATYPESRMKITLYTLDSRAPGPLE